MTFYKPIWKLSSFLRIITAAAILFNHAQSFSHDPYAQDLENVGTPFSDYEGWDFIHIDQAKNFAVFAGLVQRVDSAVTFEMSPVSTNGTDLRL